MAGLGQSYPAWLLRGGRRVLEVDGIQFTDSQDQPGSGGGSGAAAQILSIDTSGLVGVSTFAGDVPNVALGGAVTPLPQIVGAMGSVVNMENIGCRAKGVFPVGLMDTLLSASVTDIAGTNAATFSASGSFSGTGVDQTANFDGSGGTWTITAGTDLTEDGATLSSTAGGAYFLVIASNVSPD